jgi:N-acetylglucosamine kinase-like BadF-type ATPase
MIIVADSGSTKTDWALIKESGVEYVKTIGLNPYFLSKEELAKGIYSALKNVDMDEIEGIYFFGAGTSAAANRDKIKSVFVEFFPRLNEIVIDTDLYGAAKALFKEDKGIACILGTGSNSCYYDGTQIVDNVNSLGYLLGDNGSGAVLGLKLMQMYLRNKLSPKLAKKFRDEYNLDYRYILDNVYKQSTPNKFFAKFSPFIIANINDEVINKMVKDDIREFVDYFIVNYDNYKNLPIRIIGSIGYFYEDVINEVFAEYGLKIDKISKTPIEALVEYYSQFVGVKH